MSNNDIAFIILVIGIGQFLVMYIGYKCFMDWIHDIKKQIKETSLWLAEQYYEETGCIMDEIDMMCDFSEDEEEADSGDDEAREDS